MRRCYLIGLSSGGRSFFGFENVDEVATGFTDGGDDGFEVGGFGLFVNFDEDVALAGGRVAEDAGEGAGEFVGGDFLTVEVDLETGVDGDRGEGCGGHFNIGELGGLPLDVAVVLGPGEDDEEDEQEEADVAHCEGRDRGRQFFAGEFHSTVMVRLDSNSRVRMPPACSMTWETRIQIG